VAFYIPLNTRSIFAPVPAFTFSSAQMDECRDYLANRTAHTECVPIVDESQLTLNGEGQLVETGYRFNPIGFEALGNALSRGLSIIFNELSGEVPSKVLYSDVKMNDIATAVSIYNMTLRVRFDSIRERTLLVNHQERAIEGFLGLDHRMLDNTEFFDLVCRMLQEHQPSAQFSRAEIIGRELRLFFIDSKSRRNDIYPDPQHSFASGWYFANREDTGQAVRAALCLYTKFGPAFEPVTAQSKVVHSGSDLYGRTSILVSRTASRALDMNEIAAGLKRLMQTSMKYSDNKAAFDEAHKRWTAYLAKYKIKLDAARTISRNAAMVGSDLRPREPIEAYTKAALEKRTLYDLFCAVLRSAKSEYAVSRDLLQGVALQMLLPSLKPTKSRKR
jgi:hypothetical protein